VGLGVGVGLGATFKMVTVALLAVERE
jgi:hypothetical protein